MLRLLDSIRNRLTGQALADWYAEQWAAQLAEEQLAVQVAEELERAEERRVRRSRGRG
jgi:hypothetical protein